METFQKLLLHNNNNNNLSLQDIIGITTLSCHLLNYLILPVIGKIHIWDCRRTHAHVNIEGFKVKVKINYQTEKYIALKKLKTWNLSIRMD